MGLLTQIIHAAAAMRQMRDDLREIVENEPIMQEQLEAIMAKVDELKAALGEIGTSVDTIKTNLDEIGVDLDAVIQKLNDASNADGLTAAEAQEVLDLVSGTKAKLTTVQDESRSIADKVPTP